MAIRIEHGPSFATAGLQAYGAGQAMGQQEFGQQQMQNWLQYYGVKKPLEVQERIADKNLAFSREDLGARKDWFDRNYILDEQRVGHDAKRIGFEGERVQIDRDRLGIDQQSVNQQMQIAQMSAAMQAATAQYQGQVSHANQRAQSGRSLNPAHYNGRLINGAPASEYRPDYGMPGQFDFQSIIGQYGTQGLGNASLAPMNTTSYRRN